MSEYLIASVRTREDTDRIHRRLLTTYLGWIGSMRSHEAYEERKLYPYLEARFAVSFDALRGGHEQLHERSDAVIEAWEAPGREGLGRALEEHDRVLVAHLGEEEDAVIPLLLSLSREEFTTYYHSRSITQLLRQLGDR